ncbi:MAG: EAL domain-containing protein, partial [Pseudomonadota bacterium]|nr:EAL domain-containing protein [Pseudomonadota bacterium]
RMQPQSDNKAGSRASPLRLLVLTDHPAHGRLLLQTLAGAQPAVACTLVNTAAQLRSALSEPPDLILSDYDHPRFGTLQVLEMLAERGLNIPVLPVTDAAEAEAVTAATAGCEQLPLERLAQLGQTVQRVMQKRALHRARRQFTQAMELSEAHFRSLAESAGVGILLAQDGRLIYANPAARRITGQSADQLLAQPVWAFIHPDDRALVEAAVPAQEPEATPQRCEVRLLARQGDCRWVDIITTALAYAGGTAILIVCIDITQRKAAEQQMLHDALHDALTDLPNRVLLLDRLEHALQLRRRHPEFRFAVLYLDLDSLKPVNDSLGHLAGDELLINVARRLRHCVRPNDTVARLGGDEFAILVEDVAGSDEAVVIARRIQGALDQPLILGGRNVSTSASIGITLSDDAYRRPDEVLRDADTAMYQAKTHGKARHVVFDRALHGDDGLWRLEEALRQALRRQEFALHYQPIVALDSGHIEGMEALLRWQHPQQGLLAPAAFVPAAEECGLMPAIGDWVLDQVCRQQQRWRDRLGRRAPAFVTVNLAASQCVQETLTARVDSVLDATGLPGPCLRLELSEAILKETPLGTEQLLTQLHRRGVGICLDNVGTGYSSLSQLPGLPLAALKIDRRFVRRCVTDQAQARVIMAIVTLARTLEMQTIAAGVEDPAQRARLRALGCQWGQGHAFAPPLAAERAEAFLRQGH